MSEVIHTMLHEMNGQLGEVRGQIREMIHNDANMQQKLDKIYDDVTVMRAKVSEMDHVKSRVDALENDVSQLKRQKYQLEGAGMLGERVFSWKFIGWLVAIGGAIWAWATGKVQL